MSQPAETSSSAQVLDTDADLHDPVVAARVWLNRFDRVALATVVSTWGASPVPVGGQMAIAPGERFEGSVSGGCVEAAVIAEADFVMRDGAPKVLSFGVEDATAWRAGLPCGGRIEILIVALDRARGSPLLDQILAARAAREETLLRASLADGACDLLVRGSPHEQPWQTGFVGEGAGREFRQVLAPATHVVLIGATQIAQTVARLARELGWRISLVDPRSAFASEDRFAGFDRHVAWPETVLTAGLDAHAAVVALTHVGHIDDEGLIAALRSPAFYIGALGSRATHAKRVERLRAAGLSEAEIARIRAPVGLAIGAKGPHEIAVSIIAEIVRDRRAG